ncbi:hypothetical protein PsorP6_014665 [Peronosclerospora sorghi]|uniref:Uncharacterized protein n=1 Tax=Peronosclerospora sorghi TaxID=230839 RepID=A0ACC0VU89_9STRA|nr:hypothetical protein PsorP6_014665 [Peronosclerospora sorghi]
MPVKRSHEHTRAPSSELHKFQLPFILNVASQSEFQGGQSTRVEIVAVAASKSGTWDLVPNAKAYSEMMKEEKKRRRTCKHEGCHNYIVHKGGSVTCKHDGCNKKAKSRGLCWSHGGGTKCTSAECSKIAVSNGLCWAHGGGKRCEINGCNKAAYERTQKLCEEHFVRKTTNRACPFVPYG